MIRIFTNLVFICMTFVLNAQDSDTLYLWPGAVPNQTIQKSEALISENKSGNVTRLAEVTNPMLIAFHPTTAVLNTSIIICPGGGYHHLAIDKEGYEIAQWFNQMGITAYVLQYRVPDNRAGALQDIQRAIRLVRSKAPDNTIGVMGFSAGGSLCARASTLFDSSSYPTIDQVDQISAKPDFAVLMYPAYLDLGENYSLTPELKITKETPKTFIFASADDKHSNSALVYASALRNKSIPVNLHLLANGGHGFGMRPGNTAAETWPDLLKEWIKTSILEKD